jgi:hypothetical protein
MLMIKAALLALALTACAPSYRLAKGCPSSTEANIDFGIDVALILSSFGTAATGHIKLVAATYVFLTGFVAADHFAFQGCPRY